MSGCDTGGTGLPGTPDNGALDGVWAITRGAVKVTFSWTVNNGGTVTQDTQTSELVPLDKADFPDLLDPLVDQWNAGLADLNANLDAAMPDEVLVTFPALLQMRIVDAADPLQFLDGFIGTDDKYLFIGDLAGAGDGSDQGAGAVLDVSTIDGAIDRQARATTGKVARTLAVILLGSNGAMAMSAQITVDFTGQRTGNLPDSGGGDVSSAP